MKNKTTVLTTLICLLPILLGIIVYEQLPETIAVHFNSSGVGDNYLPKAVVVFALPVLFCAINAYSHFRLYAEPKNSNIANITKAILQWITPLLSVIVMPITLFISMGVSIPIIIIVQSAVGVIIIAIGNYFPKCKSNYTVGIKLPWTLSSEDNWFKTHRFSGYLWVIGGFVLLLNGIFSLSVYITLITIAVLVILPFVYSYTSYQKSK